MKLWINKTRGQSFTTNFDWEAFLFYEAAKWAFSDDVKVIKILTKER